MMIVENEGAVNIEGVLLASTAAAGDFHINFAFYSLSNWDQKRISKGRAMAKIFNCNDHGQSNHHVSLGFFFTKIEQ